MKFSLLSRFSDRISTRWQVAGRSESGAATWQAVLLVLAVVILGS